MVVVPKPGRLVAPILAAEDAPKRRAIVVLEEEEVDLMGVLVLDQAPCVLRAERGVQDDVLVEDYDTGLRARAAAVGDADGDLVGDAAEVEPARVERGPDGGLRFGASALDDVVTARRLRRPGQGQRRQETDESGAKSASHVLVVPPAKLPGVPRFPASLPVLSPIRRRA